MKTAALAILLALSLAGCSKQERADAGNTADRAVKDAGHALKNAGATLSDAGVTAKVKSAMSVSDKLDSSDVDVDTQNKVVYIRGKVADENQRALAERIAHDTVGNDIKIVNELKVAPPKKAGQAKSKQM